MIDNGDEARLQGRRRRYIHMYIHTSWLGFVVRFLLGL